MNWCHLLPTRYCSTPGSLACETDVVLILISKNCNICSRFSFISAGCVVPSISQLNLISLITDLTSCASAVKRHTGCKGGREDARMLITSCGGKCLRVFMSAFYLIRRKKQIVRENVNWEVLSDCASDRLPVCCSEERLIANMPFIKGQFFQHLLTYHYCFECVFNVVIWDFSSINVIHLRIRCLSSELSRVAP